MTDEEKKILFAKIDRSLEAILNGWTTKEQAHHMADSILTLRPLVTVEIGVYAGKGLIALALAQKATGQGKVIGIDPWLPEASAEGQPEEHRTWWSKLDHNSIYEQCLAALKRYGVESFVELRRQKSGDAIPPEKIGVLRIDGNHGPQSKSDVLRYAPNVVLNGMVYLDDATWTNGPLQNGADEDLFDMGFEQVLDLGGGTLVFKRVRA